MNRWYLGGIFVLLTAACGVEGNGALSAEEPAEPAAEAAAAATPEPEPRFPTMEAWADMVARVDARVEETDRLLRRVPNLTRTEQATLRQDVNATQTARARALGVRAGDDVQPLVERGRLVRVPDTTDVWVVRDLSHSKPYVTPATLAMLEELGERFHAALDEEGLPRFRVEITSVLRTPEHQRALRRINPNAAAGESAHEFGTTVDVAYRRFSAPDLPPELLDGAPLDPAVHDALVRLHAVQMEELARLRGTELQALLGRVIIDMRRERKLLVRMENRQTVYHMTVNR